MGEDGIGSPNALATTQGRSGAAPGQMFNVEQSVQNNWEQAQAQHKQLLISAKRMDSVKKELDSLSKLGDQVQVDDVIEGAGTLVGSGFSPMALASMLSSMPTTGGEALQGWITQQEKQVAGMEDQLRAKIKSSAIHRGIAAMAALHVHHIKSQIGGTPQTSAPSPMMGVGGGTPQESPMDEDETEEME